MLGRAPIPMMPDTLAVALVVAFMSPVAAAEPFFEHLEIAPDQDGRQAYTSLGKLSDSNT